MTKGYYDSVEAILAPSKQFASDADEMIIVRNLPFHSLCEHHLLPFSGHATIGYIPAGYVIGLSKLPRLLACHARRIQLQERITESIAQDLMEHIQGIRGCGVHLQAHHSCMSHRGAASQGTMETTSLRGVFRSEAKAEFLSACR
jgi:GTP cyclohydrolase I